MELAATRPEHPKNHTRIKFPINLILKITS